MNLSDELLTVKETCKLLKISRPTLIRLIKSGEIKGFKVGKRIWKIPRCEVDKYISQKVLT